MPRGIPNAGRAYRPRLSTRWRASQAARTLGITGWHLYKNHDGVPAIHWRDERGINYMTLAEAERLVAEKENNR
jgi:hypothetical protein